METQGQPTRDCLLSLGNPLQVEGHLPQAEGRWGQRNRLFYVFANLQSLTAFFISVGTTFWNFGVAGYGLPLKTINQSHWDRCSNTLWWLLMNLDDSWWCFNLVIFARLILTVWTSLPLLLIIARLICPQVLAFRGPLSELLKLFLESSAGWSPSWRAFWAFFKSWDFSAVYPLWPASRGTSLLSNWEGTAEVSLWTSLLAV